MSEQKRAAAAECSSTHGRRAGARRAANGDAGMPLLAPAPRAAGRSPPLQSDAASKLSTASSGFAPAAPLHQRMLFFQRHHRDVNATSIINPSRDAPEAIASVPKRARQWYWFRWFATGARE